MFSRTLEDSQYSSWCPIDSYGLILASASGNSVNIQKMNTHNFKNSDFDKLGGMNTQYQIQCILWNDYSREGMKMGQIIVGLENGDLMVIDP